MWIAVELVFRHYQPQELEAGMLFMNTLYPGHEDKEQIEVWELKEENLYDQLTPEIVFMENGYPVMPYLIDDEDRAIVTPDEIGWFDPGSVSETLIKFGINEMNFIMQEFDGILEMFVDEDGLEEGEIIPIFEDDLVILRFLTDDEDAEQLYLEKE
jgi:hypothetical protein